MVVYRISYEELGSVDAQAVKQCVGETLRWAALPTCSKCRRVTRLVDAFAASRRVATAVSAALARHERHPFDEVVLEE